MTHRQKRNMITGIILGSIIGIVVILYIGYLLAIGQYGPIKNKLTNTYNVKYSSTEPVMEFVRKSKEEDEEDHSTMNGFIYIDDQKVNIKCVVGGFAKRIYFSYAGGYNPGGYTIGQDIFTAYYSIKGDTVKLKPYSDNEYVFGEYKTIELKMTSLEGN